MKESLQLASQSCRDTLELWRSTVQGSTTIYNVVLGRQTHMLQVFISSYFGALCQATGSVVQ